MNHPFQFVGHEIKHLEGLGTTLTKPPRPFRQEGQLRGFMHKHFYVPGYEHLGVNAMLAWKLGSTNSGKFSQMARKIAKHYKNRNGLEDKKQFAAELANEFRKGVQERLSGNATGNWLVYLPHESENYYLCIAKHGEDEFILNAIKSCAAEFPFINAVLASSPANQTNET
jgi:hypothetical protein